MGYGLDGVPVGSLDCWIKGTGNTAQEDEQNSTEYPAKGDYQMLGRKGDLNDVLANKSEKKSNHKTGQAKKKYLHEHKIDDVYFRSAQGFKDTNFLGSFGNGCIHR